MTTIDDGHAHRSVRVSVAVGVEQGAGIAGVGSRPIGVIEVPAIAVAADTRSEVAELVQVLLPRLIIGALLVIGADLRRCWIRGERQ